MTALIQAIRNYFKPPTLSDKLRKQMAEAHALSLSHYKLELENKVAKECNDAIAMTIANFLKGDK